MTRMLILATAIGGALAGLADDYTYKLEWDLFNSPVCMRPPPFITGSASRRITTIAIVSPLQTSSMSFKPITGMPALHPKVTNTICGEQLEAGASIPASGLWSNSGSEEAGGAGCGTKDSGEFFYAYNYPKKSSGNTGYMISGAISFYLVMDADLR